MKTLLLFISVLLLNFLATAQADYHHCGSMVNLNYKSAAMPQAKQIRDSLEQATKEYVRNDFNNSSKTIVTIPVVVHVIYKTSVHNISDAQIYSQIEVLNEDYRRLNTDTTDTPSLFKSDAADCEIEFCLAKQDPQGNYTTGITRTLTTKSTFDMATEEAKFNNSGGHDIWDRNKYLNIWVVPAINDGSYTGILGYAQLPGGGLSTTDGVVIQYNNFGRVGTLSPYYNLGRTVTHEVGHWLNLYHVWGDDGTGCWGTDEVDDTPNQADENYNCPTFPESSCSNISDMYSNYLDYTDDACMNIFTVGQKARMWATLNGYRASIKSSVGCLLNEINALPENNLNAQIAPNPSSGNFSLTLSEPVSGVFEIYNTVGEVVKTIILNHQDQENIDVSTLKEGLYFGMIKTEKINLVKKIQIIK